MNIFSSCSKHNILALTVYDILQTKGGEFAVPPQVGKLNAPLPFEYLLKNCIPALHVGLGLGTITVQRGKSCGTEDFSCSTPQVTISVTLA